MQIAGLAIPYGVPNSYAETFTPDTLGNAYLSRLTELPMLFDHERKKIVGFWTDFDSTPSGLYVRGKVTDPAMIEKVERTPEAKRKLSISYSWFAPGKAARDARVNWHASEQAQRFVYDPITIGTAMLSEISIVESPAWKESFYQVIT